MPFIVGGGARLEDLVVQRMLNPGALSQMTFCDVFIAISGGPLAPAPPAAPHTRPHPGLQPHHGRPVPPSHEEHFMGCHSAQETRV